MLAKTVFALAGLVASVSAIMVTSPTKDEKLDFSSTIEIKWTSVSTDPATFELQLVDQANINNPIVISKSVTTADNKYSLTNFVATPGAKYKFNLLSTDPKNTGILAQSETFEITKSGSPASSSSSTDGASKTTDSSSPTGTGSGDASSTDSASTTLSTQTTAGTPSKTGASASGSASSTAPVTNPNAASSLSKTAGISAGLLAGLYMLLA